MVCISVGSAYVVAICTHLLSNHLRTVIPEFKSTTLQVLPLPYSFRSFSATRGQPLIWSTRIVPVVNIFISLSCNSKSKVQNQLSKNSL